MFDVAEEGASSIQLDELAAALRKVRLRVTQARLSVLRCMHGRSAPVTHRDVCQALDSLGLNRATVYRVLLDLTEAGLLRRFDAGDHLWRFELIHGHAEDRHPHLVCRVCGVVACLPQSSVRVDLELGGAELGMSDLDVQVRGVCARCAKKS